MILYHAFWQILTWFREALFVVFRPRYWRLFLAFQFEYFLHSSYYYVDKNPDENDVFGYTPFFTAARILKKIEHWQGRSLRGERMLDLGSGDGRFLLTGAVGFGLVGLGMELNERLVAKCQAITHYIKCNAEFFDDDFMKGSWIGYEVIFVAWTTFTPSRVKAITDKAVEEMVPGAWLVTLSEPAEHDALTVIDSFSAWFSWGLSRVYVQRRYCREKQSDI